MNYAVFLARQCQVHLVGGFLDDVTRHSYSMADIIRYEGAAFDQHLKELNEKEREKRNESVGDSEQACRMAGLSHAIHRDRNVALQELLHESIYSDLLVVSPHETLTRYKEPAPTRFIRDLLSDVQCPVGLVPAKYKPITRVCFPYNGAPASVHAVHTSSYLFHSLEDVDTEVITVKTVDESLHLPDNRLMKEFIKRHYPKAEYVILKGHSEDAVIKYLMKQKEEVLVVLGAYQRGRLSGWLKPSITDYLMRHLKLPLFIAHAVNVSADSHRFDVEVCLGELNPEEISVELYAQATEGGAPVRHPMKAAELSSRQGVFMYPTTVPSDRPTAHYTPGWFPARRLLPFLWNVP